MTVTLQDYKDAPEDVKMTIADFYRKIVTDEAIRNSPNKLERIAYTNSLIGLKYFGALNPEEETAFDQALDQGTIRQSVSNPNAFLGRVPPLLFDISLTE